MLHNVVQEAIRSKERKSALLEKVMRPENAGALSTIEKIDELMAMQGRRLVVEFNQADINHSGGVSENVAGGGKPQAARRTGFCLELDRGLHRQGDSCALIAVRCALPGFVRRDGALQPQLTLGVSALGGMGRVRSCHVGSRCWCSRVSHSASVEFHFRA